MCLGLRDLAGVCLGKALAGVGLSLRLRDLAGVCSSLGLKDLAGACLSLGLLGLGFCNFVTGADSGKQAGCLTLFFVQVLGVRLVL